MKDVTNVPVFRAVFLRYNQQQKALKANDTRTTPSPLNNLSAVMTLFPDSVVTLATDMLSSAVYIRYAATTSAHDDTFLWVKEIAKCMGKMEELEKGIDILEK